MTTVDTLVAESKQQIDVLERKLMSLTRLEHQMLANETLFDEEDNAFVISLQEPDRDKLSEMKDVFKNYNQDYIDRISKMENIIKGRQRVFDAVDSNTDVFAHYPKLLTFLATKQRQLIRMLEDAKRLKLDTLAWFFLVEQVNGESNFIDSETW